MIVLKILGVWFAVSGFLTALWVGLIYAGRKLEERRASRRLRPLR